MTGITLAIAIAGCLLVLCLRPAQAFAVYIILMLFYPSYLVVQLDVFDVSVSRFVVGVLLLRCFASPQLRSSFKWCRLDTWVALSMVVGIGVSVIFSHISVMQVLINRSGVLMDTFFAYLVARLCVTDRVAMVTAVKWIGVAIVPLAVLGVIEALTGWQPYFRTMVYCPWFVHVNIDPRLGLFRAIGPFGHSIMFGAAFVLFLPFIYCLRHERNHWCPLAYLISVIVIIGALSSISSGPLMMVLMVIGCMALEHRKVLVKPLIVSAILSCIMVGIISNRPFYHVIASYSNPVGGTAWHRAKLIDLAIEHFDEWWLGGYGGLDPGWGKALGMGWTDITNHYILIGVQSGLLGVIVFCGVLAAAIMSLVRLYRTVADPVLRSWFWAMGSLIVVLIISFVSCTFFGQTITLFYCVLGMIGSSANLAPKSLVFAKEAANWPRGYRQLLTDYHD
jgi:hypothetical protein